MGARGSNRLSAEEKARRAALCQRAWEMMEADAALAQKDAAGIAGVRVGDLGKWCRRRGYSVNQLRQRQDLEAVRQAMAKIKQRDGATHP